MKRGFIDIHYYYIPISKVEGWDGKVLWLKVNKSEVKGKYERDKIPDPLQYYIKDYPYYTTDYPYYATAYYPELAMIQPRYTRPVFSYSWRYESTTCYIDVIYVIFHLTRMEKVNLA